MQKRITDDIHALMAVIPPQIGEALNHANRIDELLEVILDLGRVPTARYLDGEVILSDAEITRVEIDYVVARIGDFDADNRAGLERTLHRISGIRNRHGQVVGLTCRVGRAVYRQPCRAGADAAPHQRHPQPARAGGGPHLPRGARSLRDD